MGEKKTIPERVIELENQADWLREKEDQNAKDILACRKKIGQLIDANNDLMESFAGRLGKKEPIIITRH